jgi:DNA polymerase III gamma/tau subunit
MTSFLCDQAIDFDAVNGYEVKDIEVLINQLKISDAESERKVVVVLRNAHYLTTQAFALLYNYVRQPNASNVVLVLVSSDKSKIFPPLLDFVQHQEAA